MYLDLEWCANVCHIQCCRHCLPLTKLTPFCVSLCAVHVMQHHAQDFGPGGSGHAVAWAFLRLQGLRQQQLQGQPLQLQLQLYRYKPGVLAVAYLLIFATAPLLN